MRIAAALVLLLTLGTFAPASLYRPLPVPARAWVMFEPLPPNAIGGCRTDGLHYEGGWVLTSNHPGFGGVSAIHVADGRATAITDMGDAADFALAEVGRVPLQMRPIADPSLSKKRRDSESLTVAGDTAWIGFEWLNLIRRYRLPSWTPVAEVRPLQMRDWPRKSGAEAIVRLRDGRFLVIAEGTSEALLFDRDPLEGGAATRLRYPGAEGFRPVDVAELADGRLLVVNRRWHLLKGPMTFAATLGIASLPDLESREIARFQQPCLSENFEAVSVTHDNGRETVWLASDDNFGPLQRTLLLKFALKPRA